MSETEEFLEVLLKRLPEPAETIGNIGRVYGRQEIIQALRDMMIGEPGKGKVLHDSDLLDGKPVTRIVDKHGGFVRAKMTGHHGIDGEEVRVIVVGEGGEE